MLVPNQRSCSWRSRAPSLTCTLVPETGTHAPGGGRSGRASPGRSRACEDGARKADVPGAPASAALRGQSARRPQRSEGLLRARPRAATLCAPRRSRRPAGRALRRPVLNAEPEGELRCSRQRPRDAPSCGARTKALAEASSVPKRAHRIVFIFLSVLLLCS